MSVLVLSGERGPSAVWPLVLFSLYNLFFVRTSCTVGGVQAVVFGGSVLLQWALWAGEQPGRVVVFPSIFLVLVEPEDVPLTKYAGLQWAGGTLPVSLFFMKVILIIRLSPGCTNLPEKAQPNLTNKMWSTAQLKAPLYLKAYGSDTFHRCSSLRATASSSLHFHPPPTRSTYTPHRWMGSTWRQTRPLKFMGARVFVYMQ